MYIRGFSDNQRSAVPTVPPMPNAFTVHWSSDRTSLLPASGWRGKPLPWLFGGPHISHPSLTRAGVAAGDSIFPIALKRGRLMVLCECEVQEVIPIKEFETRFGVPYRLAFQSEHLREWLAERNCAWLAPTCTDDVALLRTATPLTLDRYVPQDRMAEIRMLNKRGDRPLSNLSPDGLLKNPATLCGWYYKLSPATAELFRSVIARP
jgi:hypothetical protein